MTLPMLSAPPAVALLVDNRPLLMFFAVRATSAASVFPSTLPHAAWAVILLPGNRWVARLVAVSMVKVDMAAVSSRLRLGPPILCQPQFADNGASLTNEAARGPAERSFGLRRR